MACSFCCDLDNRNIFEVAVPFTFGAFNSNAVMSVRYDEIGGESRIISSFWANYGEDKIEEIKLGINFCPICGRKFTVKSSQPIH